MVLAVPVALAVAAQAPEVVATASAAHPSACELVQTSELGGPWKDAVGGLRTWMSGGSDHDGDCSRVELHPDGARVWVLFTTSDGRHAQRLVATADELLSVVEALAYTLPAPPKAESPATHAAAPAPSPLPHPLPAPKPVSPAPPAPSPTSAGERGGPTGGGNLPGIQIDARTGVRIPGPASCGSPASSTCSFALLSMGLGVGMYLGRWEIGVAASYEPAHATLAGSPVGLTMSSYSAVLSVARHEDLGPLDVALGATAGIQLTYESNENTNNGQAGGNQDTITVPEPRFGLFTGLVLPSHARLRFRPQLAFDVVPSHLGQSLSKPESGLPALPWWSASASLGVQWETH